MALANGPTSAGVSPNIVLCNRMVTTMGGLATAKQSGGEVRLLVVCKVGLASRGPPLPRVGGAATSVPHEGEVICGSTAALPSSMKAPGGAFKASCMCRIYATDNLVPKMLLATQTGQR